MGKECSQNGRRKKFFQYIKEGLVVYGRTVLYLEEIYVSVWNSIDSAQNRNYWRALVDAALNLRVP